MAFGMDVNVRTATSAQDWLVTIVYLIVLPNALCSLVSWVFALDRAFVNLDYFLPALLYLAGWRWLASGLLLLFLVVDCLMLANLMFPFVRIQDVSYLLGLLPYAAPVWQLAALACLLAVLSVVTVMHGWGARSLKVLPCLVVLNLALILYGNHAYSEDKQVERYYRHAVVPVNSQTLGFISARQGMFALQVMNDDGSNPVKKTGFIGKTRDWVGQPVEDLNDKLLLVIAESWGVMRNEALNEAILRPLLAMQGQVDDFQRGTLETFGATVAAELRELCGATANHYNFKNVTEGFEDCLPWRLRAAGYRTEAVHGAVGLMYDRVHWYPRAGFELAHFKETEAWESHCYSFPGACDVEIMQTYLKSVFDQPGKQFVYWLTLNTHAIYDERDLRAPLLDCPAFDLDPDSETCRMVQLQAQFFNDFVQLLNAGALKGVQMIVVGDHDPRILNLEEAERHVMPNAVSWVSFTVK